MGAHDIVFWCVIFSFFMLCYIIIVRVVFWVSSMDTSHRLV
jgi:hypothetical protein